jgi:uncharacterized protein (DUF58 family)
MINIHKLERLARHAKWRFGPNAASPWSGRRRSVRRGQGISFSGHREYQYGDDLRHIDWKVTARLARPFVKVFEQEQAGTLLVALDASASMRSEPGSAAPDAAVEVSAFMILVALHANERVGALLFTDRVERVIPPRRGRAHALGIVAILDAHRSRSTRTAVAAGLDAVGRLEPRRSNVIVVSDFLDPHYEAALAHVSRRHDVLALCIDRSAHPLPATGGLVRARDPESGQIRWIDLGSRTVQAAIADRQKALLQTRRAVFERTRVPLVEIDPAQSWLRTLLRFGMRYDPAAR